MKTSSVVVVVAFFAFSSASAQALKLNRSLELRLRHPEVVADSKLGVWLAANSISAWYESASGEVSQVTVESADGRSAYVAEFSGVGQRKEFVRSKIVDLTPFLLFKLQAISTALERFHGGKVIAVHPAVVWPVSPATEFDFAWRVDVSNSVAGSLWFSRRGEQGYEAESVTRGAIQHVAAPCDPNADDSLGENDLEHPSMFRQLATSWIEPIKNSNNEDKALLLNEIVGRDKYNSTSVSEYYTVADILFPSQGVECDEYAVYEVAMLRALNIKARMKYVRITSEDSTDVHAFVEFDDGKGVSNKPHWVHIDPSLGLENDPGFYRRQKGVKSVDVEDVDFPDDARSTTVDDPEGDGILAMFDDFCQSGWAPRAGYSF